MVPHLLHEVWLDRLVAQADPDRRLRLSLDAVLAISQCGGVSLWMESPELGFVLQREIGAPAIPASGVLDMVAQGSWDPRQGGLRICIAGAAPLRMAWVLCSPIPEEDAILDSIEAFLFLVHTLHPNHSDREGPSLLPSDGDR